MQLKFLVVILLELHQKIKWLVYLGLKVCTSQEPEASENIKEAGAFAS
jgi:hypothetical protein